MRRFVTNFILPWKGVLSFGIIIAIVGGIQWSVHAAIVSNTVTARDAACTAKSFGSDGRRVIMKLDCSGSEDETDDGGFIAAYLRKQGPFTCTRYVWAYGDCKLQEAEKTNK